MYKIYTAQVTRFGSPAIVITTAYTNAGGYFKAESFCVFPQPHIENVFKAFRFEKKSFDGSAIELNEAFMFEEALAQARVDIGLHIEKHYSEKSFLIPIIQTSDTSYIDGEKVDPQNIYEYEL